MSVEQQKRKVASVLVLADLKVPFEMCLNILRQLYHDNHHTWFTYQDLCEYYYKLCDRCDIEPENIVVSQ